MKRFVWGVVSLVFSIAAVGLVIFGFSLVLMVLFVFFLIMQEYL